MVEHDPGERVVDSLDPATVAVPDETDPLESGLDIISASDLTDAAQKVVAASKN